jgi:hypothetical protein
MSSEKEAQTRWVQTKLEEIENCGDQPRNHWRAARELVAGLLKGHHKKTRIIKMMKADGTLASNQEEKPKSSKTISKRTYSIEMRSLATMTLFDEIDLIPCDQRLEIP